MDAFLRIMLRQHIQALGSSAPAAFQHEAEIDISSILRFTVDLYSTQFKMLRSERTTTSLGTTLTSSTQTITVRDFLSLLNSHDFKRVQIESMTQYRKAVLSDSGSQFTIYTDDGIKRYGQPDAVVKCAKFKLSKTAAASGTHTHVRLQSFTRPDL